MPIRTLNLEGLVFGRLTVRKKAPMVGRARLTRWWCECVCGRVTSVFTFQLTKGRTKSCGCLAQELSRARIKHGMYGTPEYRSWQAMKQRCHDPNAFRFPSYGGRGIVVCSRWRDSFENFFTDMGIRPPRTSIDRINGDGNYEPHNCRWATFKQQAENRKPRRVK